ncbi:polysaccharide biosynthesis tyrosine autokinase [Roseibaca sp. V10]|uniref:Polysaccharide biosynthesis tyrosine autokinase n=1 Tax=Roseinatronobacter domitianus TaxID=2940293 RepID=A0ABT0M2S7_9RHOB|nr:polysaccharide biosynthesis tyrosine autokinase [Roseibaca domitiana]MCL1629166.1 polysaccharide biosynthesis tyrosine autokinase [Roseibaca domitiana]
MTESDDEGSEIQLSDIFAQLMARKWIILATTFVGLLIGLFQGQLPPDEYRASALVNIEKRQQNIELPEILIGGGLRSDTTRISAEAHIINSRFILDPVVRDLNLDWRLTPQRFPVIGHVAERRAVPSIPNFIAPSYTRYGDEIEMDLLEVDEPLIGRRATLEVTGAETFMVRFGQQAPIEGKVGEIVQVVPGFRFRISEMALPAGRIFTVQRVPMRVAAARLRAGLSVRERTPPINSGIVDFRFTSTDRDLTLQAVNAIVDSYRAQTLDRRSAEIDQSLDFIQDQLEDVRLQSAQAAQELSEFRSQRETTQLTTNSQELLDRIVGIEAEIEELRFREEQLAQRLTENHPDYRALIDRRVRLESRLEEMRTAATQLPPLEQELLRLTQAQERAIEIERQLSARSEQLGVVRASTVSNVHMLEPAEAASHIGPNRTRPLQLGGMLGLVLGIGFVLGLNFMRRGIDDSRTIEELGLSLFATINRVTGLRTGGHSDPNYALARTMPSDIVVESLRGLRTGLQFSLASAERKSLMITSPAPSLGKSFVSFNLALVSAQAGGRILLIDADMRKGKLRRQFNQSQKSKGLSELLSRSATIEDVLVTDPDTGLDFIGSGKYPPNPADLLTSAAFDQLMRDASDAYDLVIIDTPPVLAVTDPGIIGQKVGMSLLVVKHLETTRAEILSTVKILDTSGVKLSGAILNQFDASASRYGHYGHKYGYYGGYKYGYD